MATNFLTDMFLKNLQFTGQHKFADGGGLYIYLTPNGSKLWRMKYRFNGKEKTLSFGAYPIVSLSEARGLRDAAKKLLSQKLDSGAKKQEEVAEKLRQEDVFERVAREWFDRNLDALKETTRNRIIQNLSKDVFPYIGDIPISELTTKNVMQVCLRVEARGAGEIAHRILRDCGRIMRYAIASDRAEHDVTVYLKGSLKPIKNRHYPTITDPQKVGELLRAIDGYDGHFVVACAFKLLPLVFLRPGELRNGEWSEIDFDNKEWRIPDNRMKIGIQHIVPLSKQSLAILHALHPVTGDGKLMFPSLRTLDRPISENTLNSALRRIGYSKDEICPHGFRAMASTLLNELGYNRDWIERQLAHGEKNTIRAAYNHAEYLVERRVMMQEWADYLHKLKTN